MDIKELLESGKLELYVYGLLSPEDTKEIAALAAKHKEINDEIVSIERSMLQLSSSFSPNIPSSTYDSIKNKLELNGGNTPSIPKNNITSYLGWAASAILLAGSLFLYNSNKKCAATQIELSKENVILKDSIQLLKSQKLQSTNAYAIVKDAKNTIVKLAGQAASTTSNARVYWSKNAKNVIVDASGLPTPPPGKVYQVWALTLDPLTPTSIGLLSDFEQNDLGLFEVANTSDVQAFGITLEPAGGSKSPTMTQLFALGKI
jgi:anti-sigma-K factor RskA